MNAFKKSINIGVIAIFVHEVENDFRLERNFLRKTPGKDPEIIEFRVLTGTDQLDDDIVFKEPAGPIVEVRNKCRIQSLFGLLVVEALIDSDCSWRTVGVTARR